MNKTGHFYQVLSDIFILSFKMIYLGSSVLFIWECWRYIRETSAQIELFLFMIIIQTTSTTDNNNNSNNNKNRLAN